ncbi:MAG TPA: toll/interleukin-1 receptor domain-containing protein [Accumulibacter sp.]|nr:toll/interleukin-1 receptor domain-containing protein [Accumulibacter sp.]HNL14860.1 toll/interleukin-1 receptor domain-containing protein [Accumulibacter sp.]HNM75994.1 toll/interleukin-1 receptor domain-containing protein [Accumulibacter sp.]HNO58624.1 toll/interleukin-1 receptor domain-containing protein [Accumulibacter sp.]
MATATQEETADNGIFISYSHAQGDWVLDRLLPVLRAGGAGAIVDRDRFVAGKAVVGQMDAAQDQAAKTLLVLSPEYLASDYCQHEMRGRSPATRPSATAGSSRCYAIPARRPPNSPPTNRCTSTSATRNRTRRYPGAPCCKRPAPISAATRRTGCARATPCDATCRADDRSTSSPATACAGGRCSRNCRPTSPSTNAGWRWSTSNAAPPLRAAA